MTEHPLEVTAVVASRLGLHARPAARFAAAAAESGLPVSLMSQGRIVNAASILGVLSLGIAHGAEVTLAATGSGADEVLASLANLLSIDMDAE